MKVIICGKGGSGKSTISTLTAKKLAEEGFNVLLIDADESNLGIHKLMGADSPEIFMDSIGGKKGWKAKMNNPAERGGETIFNDPLTIDTLPEECVAQVDGVKLFAVGKIHHSGEGCACPMGALSRLILSKLTFGEKDIVLIDTAAGIEHFGRGIDERCDMLLAVVDPTYESFLLAKKMAGISDVAGMEIAFVLNKVDPRVEEKMTAQMGADNVIAKIENSDEIFMNSLEGEKLTVKIPAVDQIADHIKSRKGKTKIKPILGF